jgi:hypothetical protein
MNGDATKCIEHSGCIARISTLEKSDDDQWKGLKEMDIRMDTIGARINIILGGVAVSCILLAVNLIVGK